VRVGFSLLTLFPGQVGGSETYARALLDELAGAPVDVVALVSRHVGPLPVPAVEVASYRPGASAPTRLAAMLHAAARPGAVARDVPAGLDVVHHPLTVPIPRPAGVPVVTTLHDLNHHDLPATFSRAERLFRRWAYDDAARRAAVVVTPSEFSRARAIEVLELDPGRVRAVHSGIDHERFHPDQDPPRTPVPERFLYYPANLWPHKNHERLLAALARIDDMPLVLTGQAYGREAWLSEAARRHGVADRVHFGGHVGADEVPRLMAAASAVVFPSLAEGFGQPPLEALACGAALACSTAGSLPEVVGDAAVLFDPHDPEAIAAAIAEALRDGPRPGGREHAQRFTWAASAQGHLEAYRAAAEGVSSPANAKT
jgi:glycosyltransferase involved in cell wall biosynthesis